MEVLRVAAYCRVSTDQDDQLNSLANQQKYFSEYIQTHPGWELTEIYSDEGISGTSTQKRVNFNRMIADAEQHKMDLILTKEVSRFARNTMDTLEYTRRLKELNISVVFINDKINTAVYDDEFQLTLMAALAQKESARTSERVKWGQKRSMENGVVFGRDLLGYTVRDGILTVNAAEAQIVRLIFHKYLNEGKGTHVIAQELQEEGYRPKRGSQWSNTSILRILRNEKYVGDLVQQKTYTPNYLNHRKKINSGAVETVCIKNHHKPIIDRPTWNKTQAELQRRSPAEKQEKKFSNRYWCSGKLICGECGHSFVSRTKRLKDGSVYHAWRCSAAVNYGNTKPDDSGYCIRCNNCSISEKALCLCMKYIIQQIPFDKDAVVRDLIRAIQSVHFESHPVDIALLQNKISGLENKKKAAIDLALDETISEVDLKRQIQFYNQEIATINSQIRNTADTNGVPQKQKWEIADYRSVIQSILELNGQQELLYHELVDKIILYSNNILIVRLNGVPFGIRLHYRASGRCEKYSVTIDHLQLIPSGSPIEGTFPQAGDGTSDS